MSPGIPVHPTGEQSGLADHDTHVVQVLADGGRIIFNLVRSWQISWGREMARAGDRNRFVGIFASKDLAAVAPSDGPSASLCVAIFKPFL